MLGGLFRSESVESELGGAINSVPPSQFALKIPNKKALRDFFHRHCQKYVPPHREMTMDFMRDILAGRK